MDKAARTLEATYFNKTAGRFSGRRTAEITVQVRRVGEPTERGDVEISGMLEVSWQGEGDRNSTPFVAVFSTYHLGRYTVSFPGVNITSVNGILEDAFRGVVGDRPLWEG